MSITQLSAAGLECQAVICIETITFFVARSTKSEWFPANEMTGGE
jgi:hypothetical protein